MIIQTISDRLST